MTGCVFTVELSVSAGPSSTSFQRSSPSASDASEKVSRTACDPANPFIMPTLCEPWPGNTKATLLMESSALPPQERCAPGEAPTDAFEQHVLAGAYPLGSHRLI